MRSDLAPRPGRMAQRLGAICLVLGVVLLLAPSSRGQSAGASPTTSTPATSTTTTTLPTSAVRDGVVTQPFSAASEAGLASWVTGASGAGTFVPTLVNVGGTGWLRLTETPVTSQTATPSSGSVSAKSTPPAQAGYAVLNRPLDASTGISVDFRYADPGGTTDPGGMAVFLVDGSAAPLAAAPGPGLGYALSGVVPSSGVAKGVVGIGLDSAGAFASPYSANPLSGPGYWPEAVSVRGPGDGSNGFAFLAGRSLTSASGVPATTRLEGVDESTGGRPVRITITGGQLTVSMDFGAGLVTVLGPIRSPDLPVSGLVKVGFVATGSDIHEIRDVQVSVPAGASSSLLPATTAPSTTAPSTTVPSTTAPSTTAPSTTAPSTTAPSSTAVASTAAPTTPGSTVAGTGGATGQASTQPPSAELPLAAHPVTEGTLAQSSTTAPGSHRVRTAVVSTLINVAVTAQPIAPGASGPMTVTLSNVSGAALTSSVTLNIRLPDGASIPAASPLPGGCSSVYGSLVNCTIPSSQMGAGARVDLTIQAAIDASTPIGSTLNGGAVTPFLNGDSASGQPVAFTMAAAGATTATTAPSTSAAAATTSVATASTAAAPAPTGLSTLPFTGAQVGGLTLRGLILIAIGAALVLASLARRRTARTLAVATTAAAPAPQPAATRSSAFPASANRAVDGSAVRTTGGPGSRADAPPAHSALYGAGAVVVAVAAVARRAVRGRSRPH